MSTIPESIPIMLVDDDERLIKDEREKISVREQLGNLLLAPNLTTEQRDTVLSNLFTEEIIEGGFESPISQIEFIDEVTQLAHITLGAEAWAESFSEKTKQELWHVMSAETVSPLVRWVARSKGQLIMEDQGWKWGRHRVPLENLVKASDDGGKEYLHIASDAVVERDNVFNLTTSDGKKALLSDISQCNELGLSEDESTLLRVLLDPSIRDTIETELGLYIDNLTLKSQLKLVNFFAEADLGTVSRLSRSLHKDFSQNQFKLAEAFLATEFGDDFGDTILTVAEKLDGSELSPLLESISKVREEAKQFASLFAGFDPQLELEVNTAIGERMTEALCVIEELKSNSEGIATARVLKKRITIDSVARVQQAVDQVAIALQRINEDILSGEATNAYTALTSTGWNLGESKRTLLQLKPHGSPRGEYIQGVEHSEEGQVNFSVDVSSAPEAVPHEIADYRRRYALSIRLDLEGVIRDSNGGIVGFDATRDTLDVALDLGSMRAQEDNPNYIVGSVVSLGNKLRLRKLAKGRSRGYHTNLDARYGEKGVFAALVEYTEQKLTRRSSSQPVSLPRVTALGHVAHQMPALPQERVAS